MESTDEVSGGTREDSELETPTDGADALLREPIRYWWHQSSRPGSRAGVLAVFTFGVLVAFIAWGVGTEGGIYDWLLAGVNGVSIVLGLVTLLLVWYFDKRTEWMDSVPLSLDITFWYWSDAREQCSEAEQAQDSSETNDPDPKAGGSWRDWAQVKNVFLAHEGDIRNMAQQVGSQVAMTVGAESRLPLEPFVHIVDWNPRPRRVGRGGEWQRTYVVHVPLSHKPRNIGDRPEGKLKRTFRLLQKQEESLIVDGSLVDEFVKATTEHTDNQE